MHMQYLTLLPSTIYCHPTHAFSSCEEAVYTAAGTYIIYMYNRQLPVWTSSITLQSDLKCEKHSLQLAVVSEGEVHATDHQTLSQKSLLRAKALLLISQLFVYFCSFLSYPMTGRNQS